MKKKTKDVFYYILTIEEYGPDTSCKPFETRTHLFSNKEKCIDLMELDIKEASDFRGGCYERVERYYADILKWICCEFPNGVKTIWQINEIELEG